MSPTAKPRPPEAGDVFGFTHDDARTLTIDCRPPIAIELTPSEIGALRWTAGGPEPIFGGVILDRGDRGRWCLELDRSKGTYSIRCERGPS